MQQDAELEEGGVAAADLGQAHELGMADGDLVRGEGAIARIQKDSRKGIVLRFEYGDVVSGFAYVHSARIGNA